MRKQLTDEIIRVHFDLKLLDRELASQTGSERFKRGTTNLDITVLAALAGSHEMGCSEILGGNCASESANH